MTTQRLFCYFLVVSTAYQNVLTKNVDCTECVKGYSKISTKHTDHIKIKERINNIGLKSHNLPSSPFISQLTHNGDNVFLQPQIVMGSTITGPFGYEEPHQDNGDYDYNFSSSHEIVESDKSDSLTAGKYETIIETKPTDPEPLSVSTAEEVVTPLVIPEPPAYIPLNPPEVSSLHVQNIKLTDHQVHLVTKPDAEIHIPIPEPPAYIPLNPPKHPLKIIPLIPKCPPTISEIFEIPKCPPTISEKYKVFVCPPLALPQYKETLQINEFKIHPHIPYFLPGAISTNGIIPSIVKFIR